MAVSLAVGVLLAVAVTVGESVELAVAVTVTVGVSVSMAVAAAVGVVVSVGVEKLRREFYVTHVTVQFERAGLPRNGVYMPQPAAPKAGS